MVPEVGLLYAGYCRVCRTPFISTLARACYCSPECKPNPGGFVSTHRRYAIYERDGWVCRICDHPVSRLAKYPHPLSPSLDHIVPQSVRPGDHRDENLRLAHLWCNSVRSDESNLDWRDLLPAA